MSCSRGCCESQREHYLSIRLSAQATPTSKAHVVQIEEQDKANKADCAAYRRLVKGGVRTSENPGRIDGSAAYEKSLN